METTSYDSPVIGRLTMSDIQENDMLAETENMIIWRSAEEEIGYMYHLELGGVSLHLLPDEWGELTVLISVAMG